MTKMLVLNEVSSVQHPAILVRKVGCLSYEEVRTCVASKLTEFITIA
jgi:hypothetical protein